MRIQRAGARWLLCCVGAAVFACVAGCGGNAPAQTPPALSSGEVRQELEVLRHTRILFGHQSVGWNVIAGLKQLADLGQSLPIIELAAGSPGRSEGLSHFMVGHNG